MSKKTDIVESMIGRFKIRALSPGAMKQVLDEQNKVVACSGRSLPAIAMLGVGSDSMTRLVLNEQLRFEQEEMRKAILGPESTARPNSESFAFRPTDKIWLSSGQAWPLKKDTGQMWPLVFPSLSARPVLTSKFTDPQALLLLKNAEARAVR